MEVFQKQIERGPEAQQSFHDKHAPDVTVAGKGLSFTQLRRRCGVHSRKVDRKVVGGEKSASQIPVTGGGCSRKLQGYPLDMVYRRTSPLGIENKAFNELTPNYHLEHCYHHEPVAMLAQMLIMYWGLCFSGVPRCTASSPTGQSR
jgi:hypothetical protein